MNEARKKIIRNFAFWAAMSSARMAQDKNGKPTCRGKNLYKALEKADLEKKLDNLYSGKVTDFNEWHRDTAKAIGEKINSFGWAAKLLNLILKIEVYIGGLGDKKLASLIHPPLDNKLINEIIKKFHNFNKIESIKKALPIRDVGENTYYNEIIPALKEVAGKSKFIELEKLWDPTR